MFQSAINIGLLEVDSALKDPVSRQTTLENLEHDPQLETEDKTGGL